MNPRPAVHFQVLGTVRMHAGDQRLPAGTPQQRALLATLLLRDGRTVTAQELVNGVWGEESPPQALAALRTYASRLRKALGPCAEVLTSEAGGYALRLGARDTLDVRMVSELAAEAEAAAAAGDPAHAHELYGEALELWDAEPLAGVPGPDADMYRIRLSEQQLALQELRLESGLHAGLHHDLVPELTELTTHHPLRERLRELLMLALYRGGRQAEALAVYADARELLIEELGVEPRPELAELQQRILHADETLNQHRDTAQVVTATWVRPAQLPATVADFTGRENEVAELAEQLTTGGGSVMALSAVAGIGGVGKTTLAVRVAHAARESFPDGQLYVDLQGASANPSEPATVLGAFLRALGTSDSSIPKSMAERAALFRSLLDGRRVLTLLDNARDAAQVRSLLPGTQGCAALVTSRTRMVDLAGAHLVDLDVMSPDEALALFSKIVGAERVSAEREAAMDTVAACGFLPLAIRIAAARLAARRTWTVAVLASKLSDERRRLDELQAGDLAVKATFELGYSQLEMEQARAFRLLGLTEGPDISLHAAAALLDRDPGDTENVLEALVDTSLIESAAPGRYRLHDLVRLFARACAERDEQPPAEREAALLRLLEFYLATATRVYHSERPGDRLPKHLEACTTDGLTFATPTAALDWLFREAECVLSAARQASTAERVRKAADLLLISRDVSESGAFGNHFERSCAEVLRLARQLGDRHAEGRVLTALTQTYNHAGRFRDSIKHGKAAMRLTEDTGDHAARGHAANETGIVSLIIGQHDDAETYMTLARETFRSDGNLPSEASALSNLSRVKLELGHTRIAVDMAYESLEMLRAANSHLRLANGRYGLAMALTADRRYTEALEEFQAGLAVFRDTRQQLWVGMSLFRMAEIHLTTGSPGTAASLAEQCLSDLRNVGGPWRMAKALQVLGEALSLTGQPGRARVCWEQALDRFDEQGSAEAERVRQLISGAAAS